MSSSYPNTELHINGKWRSALKKEWIDVINPATEEVVGKVALSRKEDLDEALEAASKAFKSWKKT